MKSFLEYITENEKEYQFTIKLACDDVTDEMLDKLEKCLSRYELVSASKFKKTPILKHPIDFPRVKNSEIYVSDIVTKYPATRDMLEGLISKALDLPRFRVVVYSEKDPRRISSILRDENDEYSPKVGTMVSDEEEIGAEDYKLAAQCEKAIDDAVEAKAERKVTKVINDLSPEESFEPAEFEKQKPDTEVKKSVFFGREK